MVHERWNWALSIPSFMDHGPRDNCHCLGAGYSFYKTAAIDVSDSSHFLEVENGSPTCRWTGLDLAACRGQSVRIAAQSLGDNSTLQLSVRGQLNAENL